jgi:hypothetical protein
VTIADIAPMVVIASNPATMLPYRSLMNRFISSSIRPKPLQAVLPAERAGNGEKSTSSAFGSQNSQAGHRYGW